MKFPIKHGKFPDSGAWDMYMISTSKQEYCFFMAEFSVNETHCELTVEISVGTDASYLEVYLVVYYVVSKQAFYFLNFNLIFMICCYFLQKSFSLFEWKYWLFQWIQGDTYYQLIADFQASLYYV